MKKKRHRNRSEHNNTLKETREAKTLFPMFTKDQIFQLKKLAEGRGYVRKNEY